MYTTYITAVYNALMNHKRQGNKQNVQRYTNILGSEGELIEQIKCFECNKMGHYTNSCAVVNEDLQLIQMGYAKD